ncbi:MAG: hypothetical protein Q4P34_02540, partial [Tissierellia bacterium]|nr:hypothetical protein [Tissierellia bacterium]
NKINLYNLSLIPDPLHLISQDDEIESYYPQRFSIPIKPNENIICIKDEKIYISAWYEEEDIIDDEIINYKYYEKMLIYDFYGKKLDEKLGCLQRIGNNWYLI